MKTLRYVLQAIGLVCLVSIGIKSAQCAAIDAQLRLAPNSPSTLTFFGADTAIDADYAGAISLGYGSAPSAFFLYDRKNGGLLSTVAVTETSNVDRFEAIDISGDRLLVGSPRNPIGGNEVAGAVLLYDISNPREPQELLQLTAPTPGQAANFGAQIEFRGNRVLVGAYGDTFPTSAAGAAFLYDLSDLNDIQVKTLKPAGGSSVHDLFGATLSMNDETAIVGSFSGKVYLFDLASGEQRAVMQSPGPQYSHFGQSVDISAERAIVWSQWNATRGQAFGAAHLYDISDPTSPVYLRTLTGSTPLRETGYQGRVAIEGDLAVLSARSAWLAGTSGSVPGAAYAFEIGDLSDVREHRLLPSESWGGSEFGLSIDIDRTNVVVGAWGDLVSGFRSGAAYVFTVPEPAALLLFIQLAAFISVFGHRSRN